ncbi:PTS sugar transporter subunit IIA [Utexia brackfieldae]|uniref:PTS sugar transporter subunit IIA n=1 Tax=Utexia brackfieldae TaxID=3074108 RepID=UPI00370DDC5E
MTEIDHYPPLFFDELIFLDQDFEDADAFFEFIFPILYRHGFVKSTFLAAIKAREQLYPTALPTQPYVVALPHTDIEHIRQPFISVTRVKGSVPWHEMANNDQILPASFIFLLGFMEKDGHIVLLQTLLSCLSDGTFLEQLQQAKKPSQLMNLLRTNVKF